MSKTAFIPGQLVDIGHTKLHLYRRCTVNHNNTKQKIPTLIIEAGSGWSTPYYTWLQDSLAQYAVVYSYDRAGLGWSHPSRKPRDAHHIAEELALLLAHIKEPGPYWFVGHSLAAMTLRVFAKCHPEQVAGLVFLDGSHPQQFSKLSISGWETVTASCLYRSTALLAAMGLTHWFNPLAHINQAITHCLPSHAQKQLQRLSHRPQTYTTGLKESKLFEQSAQQALACGTLGKLPLLVISAAKIVDRAQRSTWLNLQKNLATLSSDSRQLILEGAGHGTLVTHAEWAKHAAQAIISRIQDTQP